MSLTAKKSTALRVLARHALGDFEVVAGRACVQSGDDALPVLLDAVLAHLPLAFEPRDREAKADDAARHHVDVAVRRIAEFPRLRLGLLLLRGQFADMPDEPLLLLHHGGAAVGGADRGVSPGGDPFGLRPGRVTSRRD